MNSELKKNAEKGLYEFTSDGNGCRIYDAQTPRYWYNYLWNEDRYCAQISQVGHGRSYYLSEKADMCMINRDRLWVTAVIRQQSLMVKENL